MSLAMPVNSKARGLAGRLALQSQALRAAEAGDIYGAVQELLGLGGGEGPKAVTQKTAQEMAKSMRRYFERCGEDKVRQFSDEALKIAQEALKTYDVAVPGADTLVVRASEPDPDRILLRDFVESHGVDNIASVMDVRFFLKVPSEVARGAGAFLRDNASSEEVDEFPAWELERAYERKVPRGSEADPAGPINAWDDDEGRWVAACEESEDEDAAAVFEKTGRMVALKSSGVWQALGDGAGGYDDTLGSPFAPFAFNSGFRQTPIDRKETEELGLLEEGEEAEPAQFDFTKMFALDSRRATARGAA